MSVSNPHDLIFKQVESQVENAKDFIRGTCPASLVRNIDLDTLILEKSSYTKEVNLP